MTYQLRKTEQGLMLYGSEMEKPNINIFLNGQYSNPTEAFDEAEYMYKKSFQPICPIHKEHEEGFRELVYDTLNKEHEHIILMSWVDKAIEQGIEIPSERVGFKSGCCGRCDGVNDECDNNGQQYAILLPEKKEEKSQEELFTEMYNIFELDAAHRPIEDTVKYLKQKFKITRI